jgi:Xaa-Pro aminopeptidase
MSHRERTEACQRRLRAGEAEAVVLFPGPNLAYLTGFEEEPGERHLLFFIAEDAVRLVVPELYADQLSDAPIPPESRIEWSDDGDPTEALGRALGDLGIGQGRVLVDDRMWARFTQDLRAAMPGAGFGLASEVLGELRIHKDESELSAMQSAAEVADEVSEAVRGMGESAVGLTERELAREIERRMTEEGGSEPSFGTIVAASENGALPHHHHGDREIREGDPVVLDFGTRVEGYPSDQTRTVVFAGDPPRGFEDAFSAVREAQQAAIDVVEPGIPAEAVDRAARELLEERGYGEQFVHRTGHGVGLEVHEEPYVVAGNDRELEPGMVFSVEPGVYLQDEFGIRIEDLVVVTEDGAERLNHSDRGWEPLV